MLKLVRVLTNEGNIVTAIELRKLATGELLRKAQMSMHGLSPAEREILNEVCRRLTDYTQIQTGPAPEPPVNAETTNHEVHVHKLNYVAGYFASVNRILSSQGVLLTDISLNEIGSTLLSHLHAWKKSAEKRDAVIYELFARGGVRFKPLALPDGIEEIAMQALKDTGQLSVSLC